MNTVAQGWRGSISRQGSVTTKIARSYHTKGAIIKEALILQKLNDHDIKRVPQLIETIEGGFRYERIPGEHFDTIFYHSSSDIQQYLAQQLLSHAYQLDQLGVIHGELHRPTGNVLVDKNNRVSIIDFERGTINDYSGKNMKAVGQWLRRQGYCTIQDLQGLKGLSLEKIYSRICGYIPTPKNKSRRGRLFKTILMIIGLVSIDLGSKYLFYDLGYSSSAQFIEPLLNLGSARSVSIPHWITWIGAAGVSGWLMYELYHQRVGRLPVSLIIAGSLGNSMDRIWYGGVRDFIDITSLIPYPIFNFADCFLVVGCGILIQYTFQHKV